MVMIMIMNTNINEHDIAALKAGNKTMYCKAEITDTDYKTVMMLDGIITSGNYSINSDADIRRTCNITMCLSKGVQNLNEDIFFNHYVRIHIGYYCFTAKEIRYYCIGIYAFDKESFRYDISGNEVSFTLLDLCSLMDSNHYGTEFGAESSAIYAVDPKTGERYSPKTEPDRIILKNIVNRLLDDFAANNTFEDNKNKIKSKLNIQKRCIDDIGRNNKSSEGYEYEWNELPYDLEFSSDSGLIDKLKQIKELYGIHEFFFDTDGCFIFREIPHTDDEMVILTDDLVQKLVISESTDTNIYDIKNVVEVWGKSVNMTKDYRRADANHDSDDTYNVTLDNYSESGYSNDIKLILKVSSSNTQENTYININGLGKRKIYDKTTGEPLTVNLLKSDTEYLFEYSANAGIKDSTTTETGGFYYLSSYQVHAVAIMTDGSAFYENEEYDENKEYDEESYRKYYEQFAKKYNTDNIVFVKDANSRYCIERIGEVRKKFSGNNYANLESDSLAADYAKAKLNQLCRRSTSLSLEMLIVPWLDVNQKIEYKPHNSNEVKTYIIKSISGDLLSGTMSVSLMDFYKTLDTEN